MVLAAITERTRCIMIPNLAGSKIDWAELRRRVPSSIWLFEDSCDTITYTADSDVSVISFYASHIITAGGLGGCVMFNNEELKRKALMFRDWGRIGNNSEDMSERFGHHVDGIEYDFKFLYGCIGWNMKASEMNAAFGLAQLDKLDRFKAIRRRNIARYCQNLAKAGTRYVLPDRPDDYDWLAMPLLYHDRKGVLRYLESNDVQIRVFFAGNITRHPAYRHYLQAFEGADQVMKEGFLIGAHHGLELSDVDRVCALLVEYDKKGGAAVEPLNKATPAEDRERLGEPGLVKAVRVRVSGAAERGRRQGPGEGDAELGCASARCADVEALKALLPRASLRNAPLWKDRGFSNSTKEAKEKLNRDPSNLQLVFELANSYAEDLQWKQCFNVISRGRHRVAEMQDERSRLLFATLYVEAAIQCKELGQALDILTEAGEPRAAEHLRLHLVSLCNVHALRNERGLALKAFHRAVADAGFDEALGALATLHESLRKTDGFEAARQVVQSMAEGPEDRMKMQALDNLQCETLQRDAEQNERNSSGRCDACSRMLLQRWRSLRASLAMFWSMLHNLLKDERLVSAPPLPQQRGVKA
ncbi:rfbH, partial [Symbiodinium natans]